MEYVNCRFCDKDNNYLLKQEGQWNIVRCKDCGLVYVNPQPGEEYLKKHYQSYLPESQKKIDDWEKMMSGIFKTSLKLIKDSVRADQVKLLDIGCAHGFFLKMVQDAGWHAQGIDLSEQAVQYALSKGLDVSKSTLFEKQYSDNSFDVISMFYVLEHLPDPMKFLKEVYRILKSGGVLLVRIPDTTPIVKILKVLNISNTLYDAPSHLTDASPEMLKLFLKKTGFKQIEHYIGGMTSPKPLPQKFISYFFGTLASALCELSNKKFLFPGVSKTTIAVK